MQLFVNSWSTSLLVAVAAEADQLYVAPSEAALLVGLGAGDHYQLTLAERDPLTGEETRYEIIRCTGAAAGVLDVERAQEGTVAQVWDAGTLIEARLTAETMETLRDNGGPALSDSAPAALAEAAAPGVATAAARGDHAHPLPTPADIGAATAAQGGKADSAVQPADLATGLGGKVDKLAGYGLSQESFTTAEKSKLAGLESSHFKGLFASLAALDAAFPTAMPGDYADVDAGVGSDVQRYLWDDSDDQWVIQAAGGGSMTPAEVKTAYESNPDTNAFTDADEAKLDAIEAGAQVNYAAVSQAEAEAGSSTVLRSWSAQRVWQAIASWWAGSAMKTKLDGIAAGATANSTDAFLRDRANHTGIQTASTISDFNSAARAQVEAELVAGSNITITPSGSGATRQLTIASTGGSSTIATQSVSSSGGVLNLSSTTAPVILVTLTENITSITLPAGVANQSIERRIVFTQAAGNYTIPTTTGAWGGIAVDGGAAIPQMGTGAGTVGVYVLVNDNNGTWRMYLDQGITTAQVGPIGGFRNLLINGNFAINQRGYVSGAATTGANQYTLDRWRVVTSGQNLSFSASGNGNQITAPAGGVEQVIEGANIAGGTYTLSWSGTAAATVNGTARANGESFTLPANTNATVRFIGGTVSQAQLEPGSVATPFEQRPFAIEVLICQRYYWKTFPYGTAPAQNSGLFPTGLKLVVQNAGAGGIVNITLPALMRAAPTITTFNPSAANANWRDITNGVDVTRFIDPIGTDNKFGISYGAGATLGAVLSIHATAEAEL